ncbi:hypothetical protein MMC07_008037 [Pseudocyphellaria aurata]|nr:hypothetical protein [Pseudocyphellaria aurata]
MFFQPLDLTTALRPVLLPDETLLFVQDAVGLYEGKFKIPNLQNGHAYLTSHRICYVDNLEPRKSSRAIDLKSIEKYEFYAGFLKSSPKITLYVKTTTSLSIQGNPLYSSNQPTAASASSLSPPTAPVPRGSSPYRNVISGSNSPRSSNITWICPICSFSNPIPANFDVSTANAYTPLPPCLACGIKPSLAHILKAAISNASARRASPGQVPSPPQPLLESHGQYNNDVNDDYNELIRTDAPPPPPESKFQCPRCTFRNHPQLLSCELCGAPLISAESSRLGALGSMINRSESPGPILDNTSSTLGVTPECVKFSFRSGGDKIFHERLKGAMVQRKWLLQNAPPVPKPGQFANESSQIPAQRTKVVGIAGLERRGQEERKKNEVVIGSAFEDLEALMASAKDIVALAESFAKTSADGSSDASALLLESATALGMVTTRDMLGSSSGSGSLYLSELSRNLAEYLTDDARGILKKEGGIMSLVDLWAVFNRARGGVDLISPVDFEKATRLWEKLNLPVRLRQFKNGLLVVQRHDWTDDKTIAQLLAWFQELHETPPLPGEDVKWDWQAFGRGVTAQEAARRFGWSVGVASEELEMAEERGVLCQEEGVEGLRFWKNYLVEEAELTGDNLPGLVSSPPGRDDEVILRNLAEMGLGSW